jgi:hemoglobin/transferrin/lactoferrin receptor protein
MAANLDSAMFKGFEFSGSYDAGVLFAEAAVTYYTGFEFCETQSSCMSGAIDNDYAMNHVPPDLMTSVTLGARLFDRRLSFGVRVTHAGERLAPLGSYHKYTGVWAPYTIADAFASYKVSDNVTFDLKGENLTDRYYVDALDGWMPAPGRTIRASLTAKF